MKLELEAPELIAALLVCAIIAFFAFVVGPCTMKYGTLDQNQRTTEERF